MFTLNMHLPILLKCAHWEVKIKQLIEITFQHGCSPENLLHIFRTSFLKGTLIPI